MLYTHVISLIIHGHIQSARQPVSSAMCWQHYLKRLGTWICCSKKGALVRGWLLSELLQATARTVTRGQQPIDTCSVRSADRASGRPHGLDGSTARASSLNKKLQLNLPTARRRRPLPSSAEPCCDLKLGVGTFSTRQRLRRTLRIETSQPQRGPLAP